MHPGSSLAEVEQLLWGAAFIGMHGAVLGITCPTETHLFARIVVGVFQVGCEKRRPQSVLLSKRAIRLIRGM